MSEFYDFSNMFFVPMERKTFNNCFLVVSEYFDIFEAISIPCIVKCNLHFMHGIRWGVNTGIETIFLTVRPQVNLT